MELHLVFVYQNGEREGCSPLLAIAKKILIPRERDNWSQKCKAAKMFELRRCLYHLPPDSAAMGYRRPPPPPAACPPPLLCEAGAAWDALA